MLKNKPNIKNDKTPKEIKSSEIYFIQFCGLKMPPSGQKYLCFSNYSLT